MNTQQQINPSGNLGEWPIKVTGPLDFNEFRKAHQRIKAVYLRRIGIIGGPVLGGLLFWSYISDGLATTLSSIFGLAAGFAVILVSSRFTVRSVFKSCPPVTQWQIHNNRIEKICGTTAKTQALRTIPFRQVTGYTASAGSLAVRQQFGDNHKVKLGKKRSKTNSVKLGGMASGLWVSLETGFVIGTA